MKTMKPGVSFGSLCLRILFCLLSASLVPLPGAAQPATGNPPPFAFASGPASGLTGLDDGGRMRISEKDRCPVCAMRPFKYPKFAAALQLHDRRTFYFCGPGCMIRCWLHPDVFLGVEKKELRLPVVTDYFSGQHMDGRLALWVAGSDIMGPMGRALVPLRSETDLEAFRRRHGGKVVFRLNEIDDKKWEELTGKNAAMPAKAGR
jgi:copper chaperone NosL